MGLATPESAVLSAIIFNALIIPCLVPLALKGVRYPISMFGCRMRNYVADTPLTIQNDAAIVRAIGCIDKDENPFEYPSQE